MSNIIRLLPDTLINQIAAGEVVQRPASVVKELVENAIDANSRTIKVVIKDAGKSLIQVIDDGTGMSEVDARMSFEKHATSKIKHTADLFNIQTMGFRGEAMASIAAVSQLEMETCLQEEELGTRLIIEGSKIKTQEPIATAKGTKISVKNLFFNVPARRNFLKSNPVEVKHIIDEFQRAALERPAISFSLHQHETEIYQLPSTKLSHRIIHLFGEAYKAQLIPCQEATDLLQIKGYIGKPAHAKKNRGEQFFFVNQRFIKSPYLHHAVKHAFEGLLASDAFPFYVLFIDMAPDKVDVNVHPTKTEVKFAEERMVYAMVEAVVKKALSVHHITPSLDFEQNINFNPFELRQPSEAKQPMNTTEKDYAQFRNHRTPSAPPQDWAQLLKHIEPTNKLVQAHMPQLLASKETNNTSPILEQAITTPPIQLHARYILVQVKAGSLLIDQNAAHERILYEQYVQMLQNKTGTSQQLLVPQHITLNPADLVLLQEYEDALRSLGFVVAPLGKDTLIVSGFPATVADHALQKLIEGLIEQLKWNKRELSLAVHENLARSLAKRACIQPGKKLSTVEINAIVDQLFACTNVNYTPDGRKIFALIKLKDMEVLLKG